MHYLNPKPKNAYVAIFYRNFAAHGGGKHCHVGLGCNALHTCKVLRAQKVRCDIFGVWTVADVRKILATNSAITHAIIEAPWISVGELQSLLRTYPNVHFVVRNHSQVGFLQVDNGGAKIIRDVMHLQDIEVNLSLSSNSLRYCRYAEEVYQARCLYLPNLYWIDRSVRKPQQMHTHKLLKVASFGAIRLLKNHATAASAAQTIARRRGCDLEFNLSVNRIEHGGGILGMIQDMFTGLKWAKLVMVPWEPWGEFRRTVATMDLCLQVSSTETFNLVTADAIAEGVPCVVGPAIEWCPPHWIAHIDDSGLIARVGNDLLNDPRAAISGLEHLEGYVAKGVRTWLSWLGGQVPSNREADY